MDKTVSFLGRTLIVGVGATAVMDVAGELIHRTWGKPPLNLALVGRWIGHFPQGVYNHASIAAAEPVKGEREIGWAAHYSIGIFFAGALILICPKWATKPKLLPALIAGWATTAAPWLIMQPAFGAGIAAAKTPNPTQARLGSLRAHTAYGLGLYVGGKIAAKLLP